GISERVIAGFTQSGWGKSVMPLELERLRRKAQEAREFAATCTDAPSKDQWLEAAEMWELLARERLAMLQDQFKHSSRVEHCFVSVGRSAGRIPACPFDQHAFDPRIATRRQHSPIPGGLECWAVPGLHSVSLPDFPFQLVHLNIGSHTDDLS